MTDEETVIISKSEYEHLLFIKQRYIDSIENNIATYQHGLNLLNEQSKIMNVIHNIAHK